MKMKKGWKQHRKSGRMQGKMWRGLLDSWHSLLGSADYLSSLTPRQIGQFSPERIRQLSVKVGDLPVEGLEMWDDEQVKALEGSQLSCLRSDQAKIIAAKGIPLVLARWIEEGEGARFLSELPTIIQALDSSQEAQRAGSKSAAAVNDSLKLSEVLVTLVEYGSDKLLSMVATALSEEQLTKAINQQIRTSLLEDALFRQRYKRDMARFVKARIDYETFDAVHEEAIEEVGKFERRFELATSKPVREQIYAEMQEWLHELPIVGLSRHLISPAKLFRACIGDQNQTLSVLVDNIRYQLEQSRCDLVQDRHLLWMSLSELKKEKQHVERLFGEVLPRADQHQKKLSTIEDSEQPFVERMQEKPLGLASFQKMDELMEKIAHELKGIEAIRKDLNTGIQEVYLLRRAVINAMQQERLEGEEEGYMSALLVQLFFRLEDLAHPKVEALIHHPLLKRFTDHFALAEGLTRIVEKMELLQGRLTGGNEVIVRAQKKVKVWKELRNKVPWVTQKGEEE
jgi:hypothetical protein